MAAGGRDFDRHSWCGAFMRGASVSKEVIPGKDTNSVFTVGGYTSSELYLPISVLQLDPADRAVLLIADVRDAVQKKTFTNWVNKHLIRSIFAFNQQAWPRLKCKNALKLNKYENSQANSLNVHTSTGAERVKEIAQCLVHDLFEDLRDGWLLISLLEVLSHRQFPRARGRMRCHQIQNVQTVLDYLKHKRIKVVNIRADEIVDGNPKLTLGLIWTLILHFQSILDFNQQSPREYPLLIKSKIVLKLNPEKHL